MKAILLAAGKGARLGPLGSDCPKCLFPINGVTLLDYVCASLRTTANVTETIVVGGHCVDVLRRRLPEGATLVENPRYASTNSLYSLWLALQHLENEDFAVFNSDVVYEPSLLGRFLRHPRGTACLVDELRPFDPREFHVVVKDGLVREHSRSVCEGASHGQCAQAFKVSGEHAWLFKERAREQIRSGATNAYACTPCDVLIQNDLFHPIYTNNATWSEFDSEADYRKCQEIFETHDAREQFLSVYGVGDDHRHSGAATESSTLLPSALRHGFQCLRRGRLPWHLRWVPELGRALQRAPIRALPYTRRLATAAMSPEGFKLRLYGPALLATVMEEAHRLGMRPFLLWGTLLGCVREGAFLPKDHDIDLGLLDPDFRRIEVLRAGLLARGLQVRQQDDYKVSFLSGAEDGLFVDIDRVYEDRNHMVVANASADPCLLYTYPFPREVFASLRHGSFEGVDVDLPGEAEAFLEIVYGTWRTPQSKREYLRGPLNLRLQWKVLERRPAATPSLPPELIPAFARTPGE